MAWDLVAISYLVVGAVVLRLRRGQDSPAGPAGGPAGPASLHGLRLLGSPRFNFAFTLAASIVGMTSASVVISHGDAPGTGPDIRFFGTIAIGCAWMLLHAGYARFYGCLYYRPGVTGGRAGGPAGGAAGGMAGGPAGGAAGGMAGGPAGGLDFPRREYPGPDDFMYFAFTLGTSFAVSDVSVTAPSLRWHVMVHSVLSFFYNAIVVALAIAVLTGR